MPRLFQIITDSCVAQTGVLLSAPILGLYLSSIGCLNLTGPLEADQEMDPKDSFDRIVAVVNAIKAALPGAFRADEPMALESASILIENGIVPTNGAP